MGATDRLKHYFDTRGVGWQIPGLIVALAAILTVIIAAVVWAREPLGDFLTADARVWHILVAAAGPVVVGAGVSLLYRRPIPREKRAAWPSEIEQYKVKWPVSVVWVGATRPEFHAGKPQCPRCRTPLGVDCGDGIEPFQLPNGTWKEIPTKGMTFRCHKDGSAYDLTEFQLPMALLIQNVEAQAEGVYRTALAAEEKR